MIKDRTRPLSESPAYCEGKFRFADFKAADKVAHRQSARRDKPVAPYRCPKCQGWHVGQPFIPFGRRVGK